MNQYEPTSEPSVQPVVKPELEHQKRGRPMSPEERLKRGGKRNISGQRFGKWTVIGNPEIRRIDKWYWECACDCGTVKMTSEASLVYSKSRSCGCEWSAHYKKRFTTHGKSRTRTHRTWIAMRRRCENPKSHVWEHYGARGIKVCERWQSFENFLADMGERPEGNSIDRIDNDGNYEPSNCRWATQKEQSNNKRSNRIIEHDGKSQTVAQWIGEKGLTVATVRSRLDNGWSDAEALEGRPSRRGKNFKDLTGQTFGRLTVVSRIRSDRHGNIIWNCICECGTEKGILRQSLLSGRTRSCGCLNRH